MPNIIQFSNVLALNIVAATFRVGTERGCNMDVNCKENRTSYLYLKPSHSLKKTEDKLYMIFPEGTLHAGALRPCIVCLKYMFSQFLKSDNPWARY